MRDVDRAIADITVIRRQLAAGALFRGFGPTVVAGTGVLAIVTAGAQSIWPGALTDGPWPFLASWIVIAVACVGLVGAEMWARSRRHHGGLGDAMVMNAAWQFLPAGVAGAGLMAVVLGFAPDLAWTLPGIWQVLFAMSLCAASRMLPRAIILVALWYFLAGLAVLALASETRELSPWHMGAPFAAGQLLMAAILALATRSGHDEG
jgi:hypothetical protein